jgi:transcriptional regulator with XRE-family HTH domain
MTTNSEDFPPRIELTEKLTEEEYRHAFIATQIRRGLPFQIRAMREARGWTQKDLGEAAEIRQANVSRAENTRDEFLSFPTLLKIAKAFDVGLLVRFAPFSELEEWETRPLPEMVPLDFASESARREEWERSKMVEAHTNVTQFEEYAATLLTQGKQNPSQEQELGYGSRRDSKGRSGLFGTLGADESTAKRRASRPDQEDGRALPFSKVPGQL